MNNATRLSLLTALALLLPVGCARTSPDTARSDTPTDSNAAPMDTSATPANDAGDPGLEPIDGPVIDNVGNSESLKPTDGAAPNRPGTQDNGNPGGPTVNEVGSPPNSGAPIPK